MTTLTATTTATNANNNVPTIVPSPALPPISPEKLATLPVVLRSKLLTTPKYRVGGEDEEGEYYYEDSWYRRFNYWMKTLSGTAVIVSAPEGTNTHHRREDGEWAFPGDPLWQCTAHALGSWDPVNRTGYVVDTNKGIWDVLNDPQHARTIMEPEQPSADSTCTGVLKDVPRGGDVFVLWENTLEADGSRKCCHAAKFIAADGNDASYTTVARKASGAQIDPSQHPTPISQIVDIEVVLVSSKNGANRVERMSLVQMLKTSTYQNKTHAIYRFQEPTNLWTLKGCLCEKCDF